MATKTNPLRDHILAILSGSTTTVTEDLDALAQCDGDVATFVTLQLPRR